MKNNVELLGHYGSDEIIALSAWTSTSRELTNEKRHRIPDLIKSLWTNRHETPFEKGVVHFLVTCDIASHIHLLKHRISSLNAESARYKELKEDNYYIPADFAVPVSKDTIKQNYNTNDWQDVLEQFTINANYLYHQCLKDLEPALGRKRAKESARYFKTYNSQITCDVMFNMRSFANFLKLRDSEHAQLEIKQIASHMAELVCGIKGNPFLHTMSQFGYIKF